MRLARVYLWFGVVSSLAGGLAYLFAPEWVTAQMGIAAVTSAGVTDLRATYAGFQLGMAGWLAWCLRDPARYRAGLLAFAWVVGGLGVVRSIGLVVDGPALEMVAAAAIEIAIAGLALWAAGGLDEAAATELRATGAE